MCIRDSSRGTSPVRVNRLGISYVNPSLERVWQRALRNPGGRRFRDVGQWWFKQRELDVLGLTDDGLPGRTGRRVGPVCTWLHRLERVSVPTFRRDAEDEQPGKEASRTEL